jgi:AraC family transcriptional regulator
VKGAPGILNVALDVGYGSHEAFTRAFREQFGVPPGKVLLIAGMGARYSCESSVGIPAQW